MHTNGSRSRDLVGTSTKVQANAEKVKNSAQVTEDTINKIQQDDTKEVGNFVTNSTVYKKDRVVGNSCFHMKMF